MGENIPLAIIIKYDHEQVRGALCLSEKTSDAIWDRICQFATTATDDYSLSSRKISIPWPILLTLIREFAPQQRRLNFRLKPDKTSKLKIDHFLHQYKSVRQSHAALTSSITIEQINERLIQFGFTKRKLLDFQLRDLQKLLSLQNGANFSVPGAGKTTVTLALNILTKQENQHLLVVGPKSSFPAWKEVVLDCIADNASDGQREAFTVLIGGGENIRALLNSGATRFLISYDQLITIPDIITNYLLHTPVHLVLDESHRMKGGLTVKRGIVLLKLATLPIRRDILSGTPMPQAPTDLQSQLDFIWPGAGLGSQIAQGKAPRQVLGNLYVRTTKADLGLPPVHRHFIPVSMSKGQAALYAIVRNESLRDLSSLRSGSGVDIVRARRSVMRLLQLSTNPLLALKAMTEDAPQVESGIVQQVLEDGPSTKMIAVRDFARQLAAQGRKTVIWSIFTDTIIQIERMLADLNPVTIVGAIPIGDEDDPNTREGRLQIFHRDPSCMTLVANPAAAGEGISLHHACHDAIYLDRSYNTTHYLQSIDRIHRLGLPSDVETHIHIFQTMAPKGLGCVDHSVSRRLAKKLRALQQLLDDQDLHQLALDEENVDELIDYDIEPDDLIDLIEELEGRTSYLEEEGI